MRLACKNQVVVVTIPQQDLFLLFMVPEFKALALRFPSWIKAQYVVSPCHLYLHRQLIPFLLETTSEFPGMQHLRESLCILPPCKVKM